MPQDVEALTAFYDTHLGQVARRAILRRVRGVWPDLKSLRLLGYGFAIPYLRAFPEAERAIAAVPAALGATRWPDRSNATAICDEDALPFPDVFFDRILVVHGLEGAEALRLLLRQLWRVLAPEGRILIVVPNRASLWAQVDISPFGHGRPFSSGELDAILRDTLFEPLSGARALYAPPLNSRTLLGSGANWERVGARLFSRMGGVHVVESSKSLYAAATPTPQGAQRTKLKPARDFNRVTARPDFSSAEK